MLGLLVFFFKQKTAYEMRISDWSSDVCSSDLATGSRVDERPAAAGGGQRQRLAAEAAPTRAHPASPRRGLRPGGCRRGGCGSHIAGCPRPRDRKSVV